MTDATVPSATVDLGAAYLANVRERFGWYKRLAEGALDQLDPEQLHVQLDPEANAVAVIVRHMAGNLRSRFRDLLTSDGEKPDRDRDAEFVDDDLEPEALRARWEQGWEALFTALDDLTSEQLLASVTIRGEPHSVLEALQRQLSHHAYHVGQIVLIAKHLRGERWRSLSIPRGASQRFNAAMGYDDRDRADIA
jgi:hypothetical protein